MIRPRMWWARVRYQFSRNWPGKSAGRHLRYIWGDVWPSCFRIRGISYLDAGFVFIFRPFERRTDGIFLREPLVEVNQFALLRTEGEVGWWIAVSQVVGKRPVTDGALRNPAFSLISRRPFRFHFRIYPSIHRLSPRLPVVSLSLLARDRTGCGNRSDKTQNL